MTSKKETPEEKQPVTDPNLEAVQAPAQDETPAVTPEEALTLTNVHTGETIEPPVEHSDAFREVVAFAMGIDHLLSHADKQAQVNSEYQSRWQWWKNHLEAFHKEVKQHVKN